MRLAGTSLLLLLTGCLQLEGRPCQSAADCVGGFECVDAFCVRAGEGEGEGEALATSRCPNVPRGEVLSDLALPAGQLSVALSDGNLVVVFGAGEDRIRSTRAGLDLDDFGGVIDVTGDAHDTVVLLSNTRLLEVETSAGDLCLDGAEGNIQASTSSGPITLFTTPTGSSTVIGLDSTSGSMEANVGLTSDVTITLDGGGVTTDPAFTCFGEDPTTCIVGGGTAAISMDSTSGDLELSSL